MDESLSHHLTKILFGYSMIYIVSIFTFNTVHLDQFILFQKFNSTCQTDCLGNPISNS